MKLGLLKGVKGLKVVMIILHVLLSVGLIASVLLQSGKSAGLSGAIAGGAETFLGKKKGLDELLQKVTTFVAFGFLVSALVLALI
ncbi:MAG: preprotein translocase subunit SecG [Desulfitobacterium hafniense]|nr:preprotein translocase subunit SecG [Desulfitobacterium hafniense]